jgi:hypothetical protein
MSGQFSNQLSQPSDTVILANLKLYIRKDIGKI